MPELPEVETTARGLARALTGARISHVEQRRKDLRTPMPANLATRLAGRRIKAITRRAKYILMAMDDGQIMLLHLGMSGRLVLDGTGKAEKHDHVVIHFADGQVLRFNDPRRFGMLDLIENEAAIARHKNLKHLGIEPLSDALTPQHMQKIFKGKTTTIKAALLDQRLIAGLGNIYVCEALFWTGISPKRKTGRVRADELKKLAPAIRKVLTAAIKAGGSSLRDYVHTDGKLGYFQNNFAVYDREGQKCKTCTCKGTGVKRIAQGGRSTFYCPFKQT